MHSKGKQLILIYLFVFRLLSNITVADISVDKQMLI